MYAIVGSYSYDNWGLTSCFIVDAKIMQFLIGIVKEHSFLQLCMPL